MKQISETVESSKQQKDNFRLQFKKSLDDFIFREQIFVVTS